MKITIIIMKKGKEEEEEGRDERRREGRETVKRVCRANLFI